MFEERRAQSAISETIRALAEPRALTNFAFYFPGGLSGVPLAIGSPDLLSTATRGRISSTDGWGDLERMGLHGGDL